MESLNNSSPNVGYDTVQLVHCLDRLHKAPVQSPMSPKSDAVDTPTVIPALKGNGDNLKGGGANGDKQHSTNEW